MLGLVPWWGWLLIAWPVLAVIVAVIIGHGIALAERRRPRETFPDDQAAFDDSGRTGFGAG